MFRHLQLLISLSFLFFWRHDNQHNDTQHSGTKQTTCVLNTVNVVILGVIMLSSIKLNVPIMSFDIVDVVL
jgi:hypothetical protein